MQFTGVFGFAKTGEGVDDVDKGGALGNTEQHEAFLFGCGDDRRRNFTVRQSLPQADAQRHSTAGAHPRRIVGTGRRVGKVNERAHR